MYCRRGGNTNISTTQILVVMRCWRTISPNTRRRRVAPNDTIPATLHWLSGKRFSTSVFRGYTYIYIYIFLLCRIFSPFGGPLVPPPGFSCGVRNTPPTLVPRSETSYLTCKCEPWLHLRMARYFYQCCKLILKEARHQYTRRFCPTMRWVKVKIRLPDDKYTPGIFHGTFLVSSSRLLCLDSKLSIFKIICDY